METLFLLRLDEYIFKMKKKNSINTHHMFVHYRKSFIEF